MLRVEVGEHPPHTVVVTVTVGVTVLVGEMLSVGEKSV
jgi:hypothetical protein